MQEMSRSPQGRTMQPQLHNGWPKDGRKLTAFLLKYFASLGVSFIPRENYTQKLWKQIYYLRIAQPFYRLEHSLYITAKLGHSLTSLYVSQHCDPGVQVQFGGEKVLDIIGVDGVTMFVLCTFSYNDDCCNTTTTSASLHCLTDVVMPAVRHRPLCAWK